ncbi:transcriptional regulator [Flavobacterium silvisoli]|uniref:Transcriptional regulator n=1 Tax=Flavobacterium silvisoli TaxID=2529433 RepID=A0A4Q9YUV8_9FLAO|nr:helix-turn-helix domain-containing protein [Flavobacterium silvisoli]TBX67488.1 transcriptional regulator [Flavobacterium silvisoli]
MIDANSKICGYITKEWLNPWMKEGKSQTAFANAHNVEESTIRKIKGSKNYRIPVETLQKICEARNLKLSEFFKLIGL